MVHSGKKWGITWGGWVGLMNAGPWGPNKELFCPVGTIYSQALLHLHMGV